MYILSFRCLYRSLELLAHFVSSSFIQTRWLLTFCNFLRFLSKDYGFTISSLFNFQGSFLPLSSVIFIITSSSGVISTISLHFYFVKFFLLKIFLFFSNFSLDSIRCFSAALLYYHILSSRVKVFWRIFSIFCQKLKLSAF